MHEFFAFTPFVVVLETELAGNLALEVKNQAVFFAFGGKVKFNTNSRQLFVAVD